MNDQYSRVDGIYERSSSVSPRMVLAVALVTSVVALAASPVVAQDCVSADVPLVAYENDEQPFPVQIELPEGWSARAQGGGRILEFFEGETFIRSEYHLRFNAPGPVDPASRTASWKAEETSKVELEGGGQVLIRSSDPHILFTAMVPTTRGDGKAILVNGGVVQAPKACREAASGVLQKIARGLRPSAS